MSGNLINFSISWTPVLLIVVLACGLRWSALRLSLAGFSYTCLLSFFWFKTSWVAIALSAIDGMATALPLILVVTLGIFLAALLMETGALTKLARWFAAGLKDFWARTLLFSAGLGNFLEGAGVVAEPLAAPMLASSGLAPARAAVLSIQGYAGLFSLELAGTVMAVLGSVTGISVYLLSWHAAWLSILPTFLMLFAIPWLAGEGAGFGQRWPLLVFCALVLNLVTLAMVLARGPVVAAATAGLVLVFLLMAFHRGELPPFKEFLVPFTPFLFVIASLFLVNLVPPIRRYVLEGAELSLRVIPIHQVVLHPLYDAYSYLFLALLLALFLFKPNGSQLRAALKKGAQQALPTLVALAFFAGMGQVVAYSGYDLQAGQVASARNMAFILASGLASYTGSLYPLFSPLLGWVGTVLTGSGMASVLLLGGLQPSIATLSGLSPALLSASLAVGSGIGSVSSPLKLAVAAAVCGAVGQEGAILRRTIPLGIAVALALGGVTLIISAWR